MNLALLDWQRGGGCQTSFPCPLHWWRTWGILVTWAGQGGSWERERELKEKVLKRSWCYHIKVNYTADLSHTHTHTYLPPSITLHNTHHVPPCPTAPCTPPPTNNKTPVAIICQETFLQPLRRLEIVKVSINYFAGGHCTSLPPLPAPGGLTPPTPPGWPPCGAVNWTVVVRQPGTTVCLVFLWWGQ